LVNGLLGRKLGMTQVFTDAGVAMPVTVIEAEPNTVTLVKSVDKDGYAAVQLGYGTVKRLNKPETGHLGKGPKVRHLREVRVSEGDAPAVGDAVDVGVFSKGDLVDVVGVSKGKGFAGVVKRHHFAGGPKTHGQSDRHRAPGSVGASSTPGRVFKGMRMAGHLGNRRTTIQNLEVAEVDVERSIILVKGAVPGAKNSLVMVRKAVKSRS
jgi:large subunit ribosomal protein L3